MIGIIIGIIVGLNYMSAAWANDVAYWSGTAGTMLLMAILGIILFPKTIARILSITLWFAPIAVFVSVFNGGFPNSTISVIIYGIFAAVALAIVKFFRLRAREVNL